MPEVSGPRCFFLQALLSAAGYTGPSSCSGIFYGGDGKQLGIQLLGALAALAWGLLMPSLLFLGLGHFNLLRVPPAAEGFGESMVFEALLEECVTVGAVEPAIRVALVACSSCQEASSLR